MKTFLKWWLFFTLVVIATVFCGFFGLLKEIWEKDASYLSYAILSLFFIGYLMCGSNLLLLGSKKKPTLAEINYFEEREEVGWFLSEVCLNLGMLGTIIGFVMMLSGFNSLDISKQHTIQNLLTDLGRSMGTALYTTLIGLICGQCLKIQYFLMGLEINKKRKLL
jgi:hypothetical protein